MFCNQCGNQIESASRFCSQCGSPVSSQIDQGNYVNLLFTDLRVPYGTATQETLSLIEEDSETIRVPKDSDLARMAKKPVDLSRIPEEGDLVPLDCAWAFMKHPGPIPESALYASSIDKKFVGMGILAGRTYTEIVTVAGPPMTKVTQMGETNAVWGKTGFLSIWQIALNFDPYGVCISIYSETNM